MEVASARDELVEIGGIGAGERARRRKRQCEKKPCGGPQGFCEAVLDR